MSPKADFEIIYSPIIRQHMSVVDRKHYSSIREAIEIQLSFEPDRESRYRKPLKRPAQNGAEWELRCGPNNRFRIFYKVDRESGEVIILAIGEKQGSILLIGGEEVAL